MGAIIPSLNYIAGDVRILGGSVVVDSGADRGLEDDSGNFAGSFTGAGNAAVGYLGDLELWAGATKQASIVGGLDAGLLFPGGSERKIKTIHQTIHAHATIIYTAGVPAAMAGAYNVASVTDNAVGDAIVNFTDAGGAGQCAVSSLTSDNIGIAHATSNNQTAARVRCRDLAGAPQDYHFHVIVGAS